MNWDEVAEESAKDTDNELAKGIGKLLSADLGALYPDPKDRELVQKLVDKVKGQTTKNEAIAAFKAGVAVLGEKALNLAKIAMLGLILAVLAAPASAQMKSIDLEAPLKDARMGISWQMDGAKLGVAYVPIMAFVGPNSGQEYVTLNGGVSDRLETGRIGYVASIGFRADTIISWLAGREFSRKYLRFAALPPLQICVGPITDDFRHFRPALTVAKKF